MRSGTMALLGLGPWGRNHYRVLDENEELRWAYDRDPDVLAREALADHRAPDLETILADPGVTGIVVATPARTHHDLAMRCLQAGKDVLVEKPLTLLEQDGASLVRQARRNRCVLMVGHITLYHPAIETLRDLVVAGELGQVRYLYANRLNLGTVREEEDILWSFAPHDLAVFLHLLGTWPEEVTAHGGSYLKPGRADVTVTHLRFPDGVQGHVFLSWLHPRKEHRLVVLGERRTAEFVDGPEGGRLVVYETVTLRSDERPPRRPEGQIVPFATEEPLRRELEHFRECRERRAEPRTGGRHGLEVLRILETARASLLEGGSVMPCAPPGDAAR